MNARKALGLAVLLALVAATVPLVAADRGQSDPGRGHPEAACWIASLNVLGTPANNLNPQTGSTVSLIGTTVCTPGYAVTGCTWSGAVSGGGSRVGYVCSFGYTPARNRTGYGIKTVTLKVNYKLAWWPYSSGSISKTLTYKVFFGRDGDDDGNKVPNWFDYWGIDGAVPGLNASHVRYEPTLGGYGKYDASAKRVLIGSSAAGTHYPGAIIVPWSSICPGGIFGGPGVATGINCAAEVLAHENRHKWIRDNWEVGGAWYGWLDSDRNKPTTGYDDRLPDIWETSQTKTSNSNVDSCNLATYKSAQYKTYGDNEWEAMTHARGRKGVAGSDWANPGKQTPFKGEAEPAVPLSRSGAVGPMASQPVPAGPPSGPTTAGDRPGYAPLVVGPWGGSGPHGAVAVFKDAHPWGTNAAETYLSAQRIPYTMHTSAEFGTLDLGGYSVVVLSSDQPQPFYDAYAAHLGWFEAYVLQGGFLAFFACDGGPNGGALTAPLPGGLIWHGGHPEEINVVIDPAHPSVHRVPSPLHGLYASHGYFANLPGDAHIVAVEHTGGQPTLVDIPVGDGRLLALAQPLEYSYDSGLDLGRILANSLGWAYFSDLQRDDLAWLTGAYADTGIDTDGDGLLDYVQLSVGVQVADAGLYNVVAYLQDQGIDVAWSATQAELVTGTHTVDLLFDGLVLRALQQDGPFAVGRVELRAGMQEHLVSVAFHPHTTGSYARGDFDPPAIAFDLEEPWDDAGYDQDGNGLFDLLRVGFYVQVDTPGTYTVTAEIQAGPPEGPVLQVAAKGAELAPGRHRGVLAFDGEVLFWHRENGPYFLRRMTIEDSAGVRHDFLHEWPLSGVYPFTQFEHRDTTVDAGSLQDQGLDADGDGLYEALEISFGFDGPPLPAGTYSLLAQLQDLDGVAISNVEFDFELPVQDPGGRIRFTFPARHIVGHAVDGPWRLGSLVLTDDEGALIDIVQGAYATAAYSCSQFKRWHWLWLPILLDRWPY